MTISELPSKDEDDLHKLLVSMLDRNEWRRAESLAYLTAIEGSPSLRLYLDEWCPRCHRSHATWRSMAECFYPRAGISPQNGRPSGNWVSVDLHYVGDPSLALHRTFAEARSYSPTGPNQQCSGSHVDWFVVRLGDDLALDTNSPDWRAPLRRAQGERRGRLTATPAEVTA